jgi:aminoglycoside phosphotransferase (APT) family kinase protein
MNVAPTGAATRPMSDRHRFDPAALSAWMATHVTGYAGPLEVVQFEGGQSNPTYLLTTPGARYVMRSKPGPVAKLLPSAHAVEREFRVMKALAGADVPVPPVLALCEDESVIGRAFFVMAHMPGRVFWDPALPGVGPTERAAIYDEVGRVLAALHRVDPAAVGLADYGRPGNYFGRQIARWSAQYRASETTPIEAMDRLIAWLPEHIPPGDETAIVHGDFRLDNLIFAPEAPRVVAIIDWELSTLGHPLADFSYYCMAWHIPPGAFRGLGGIDLAPLGIPDEATVVRQYGERTGRGAIAHWDFYLAYNLFRISAILQGVYKRATEGMAASDRAAQSGENARALAAIGWEHALRA